MEINNNVFVKHFTRIHQLLDQRRAADNDDLTQRISSFFGRIVLTNLGERRIALFINHWATLFNQVAQNEYIQLESFFAQASQEIAAMEEANEFNLTRYTQLLQASHQIVENYNAYRQWLYTNLISIDENTIAWHYFMYARNWVYNTRFVNVEQLNQRLFTYIENAFTNELDDERVDHFIDLWFTRLENILTEEYREVVDWGHELNAILEENSGYIRVEAYDELLQVESEMLASYEQQREALFSQFTEADMDDIAFFGSEGSVRSDDDVYLWSDADEAVFAANSASANSSTPENHNETAIYYGSPAGMVAGIVNGIVDGVFGSM